MTKSILEQYKQQYTKTKPESPEEIWEQFAKKTFVRLFKTSVSKQKFPLPSRYYQFVKFWFEAEQQDFLKDCLDLIKAEKFSTKRAIVKITEQWKVDNFTMLKILYLIRHTRKLFHEKKA